MSSSSSAQKTATIPCGYLKADMTWWPGYPTYVTTYSTQVWAFPSPRNKPHPLSPTYGQVQCTIRNSKSYKLRVNPNSLQVGDAVSVYRSGGPTIRSNSAADALSASLAAVAKSQTFNAASDLGESRSTVEMVAKRLRTLSEAALQLRRGNASAFAETLGLSISRRGKAAIARHYQNGFSNLWLEYTYGWKPLVSDVYDGIEAYRHGMATRGTRVHYSSGRGARVPRGGNFDNPQALLQAGYRGTYSGVIGNPTVASLNQFGLLNPASLAWELLPYSFVVDWFAPVGNILTSLTAGLGFSEKVACITYEQRSVLYCYLDTSVPWELQSLVRREPVIPQAALWRLGSLWAANLGWRRYTSAYALLQQRFGRK